MSNLRGVKFGPQRIFPHLLIYVAGVFAVVFSMFSMVPVVDASNVAATNLHRLAVGGHHVCAIASDHSVSCWGSGSLGELGLGSGITTSRAPQLLTSLSSIIDISSSETHVCALSDGGAIWCWGENTHGQLGDGTVNHSPLPTRVAPLGGATSVAVGGKTTCAIVAGLVKCWGLNNHGQLGNNSVIDSATAVDAAGPPSVVQISLGAEHACALTRDGDVWCWGANGQGQLGTGDFVDSTIPVVVTGISSAVQVVTTDQSTCALLSDKSVKCWGINNVGQLGDTGASGSSSNVPVTVTALQQLTSSLYAGQHAFCASLTDETTRCWGLNQYGILGDNSTTNATSPVQSNLVAHASEYDSSDFACVLIAINQVNCWGLNLDLQIGGSLSLQDNAPVSFVVGLSTADPITSGQLHTCALVTGVIKCWGSNTRFVTGNIDQIFWAGEPRAIEWAGHAFAHVSSGDYFNCATTVDKNVACWGMGINGQIGNGANTDAATPQFVMDPNLLTSPLASVDDVDAGGYHACVLIAGAVYCWGQGSAGQLGNGTNTGRALPTTSPVITGIAQLSLGEQHSCSVDITHGVACWGNNSQGQLGIDSQDSKNVPEAVTAVGNTAASISSGFAHTCIVTLSGGAQCWGENSSGQLGNGTTTNSDVPVEVTGLSQHVLSISAGVFNTCAVLDDHSVKCWGDNTYGVVGDNSNTHRLLPVSVAGLANVQEVTVGAFHACARFTNNSVKCWGSNSSGQLGIGLNSVMTTAIAVSLPLAPVVAVTSTTTVNNAVTTTTSNVKSSVITAPTSQILSGSNQSVNVNKSISLSTVLSKAKVVRPKSSIIKVTVRASDIKNCKIMGPKLKGIRPGSCRLSYRVTPRKGKAMSGSISVTVIK